MGPKKSLALLIVVAGIILGLFYFQKSSTPTPQIQSTASTQVTPPPLATSKIQSLGDTRIEVQERVKMLMNLEENPENTEINDISDFVVSENPLADSPEAKDPHTFQSYQFQKEASLRVFALRTLSEKLSTERFAQVVAKIESQSQDEAIKRVARQALDFKRQSRNYFEEMKKAILETPLPEKESR